MEVDRKVFEEVSHHIDDYYDISYHTFRSMTRDNPGYSSSSLLNLKLSTARRDVKMALHNDDMRLKENAKIQSPISDKEDSYKFTACVCGNKEPFSDFNSATENSPRTRRIWCPCGRTTDVHSTVGFCEDEWDRMQVKAAADSNKVH